MAEHEIQHLLQLNGGLLRLVITDALRNLAAIERLHRQLEQLLRAADPLSCGPAPEPARVLLGPLCGDLQLMIHPCHHGVEVEDRLPWALPHHLPQGGVVPALCRSDQFGVERLLVDRDRRSAVSR